MVGSFMMTVGPAMAAAAFTGGVQARNDQQAAAEATQAEMLGTMKEILLELKKQNG
jgi:hypothetical protein